MQGSKIRLSPSEAALFCNAEIILTKNTILQKTIALLTDVQEQIIEDEKLFSSPKISKGENYLGLPYVILDYPRIAKQDDLFFIRSMFWWGRFFSSTLQLSGQYKPASILKLVNAFESLSQQQYFIGINANPWLHHFEPTNYRRISEISSEEFTIILQQQAHIKIAARWSLSQWDAAANLLITSWKFLAGLVA